MRQPFGLRRVVDAFAGCSLLAMVACQSPGSRAIVGPDGSPMAHVHCGTDQGSCFRIAGELCPGGYELKPVLSGHDGNFLVRCRNVGATAAVAVCPPAGQFLAAGATIARPPNVGNQKWPPAAEPSAAYPWPSSETSAAARPQPSAPTVQPGEVDLGY